MGKVSQLESMVKLLQEDLKKVSYGSASPMDAVILHAVHLSQEGSYDH